MTAWYNQCCRLVSRSSTCKRVVCDALAIAALVTVLVGVLAARNGGRVVRRGFFCDDESIRLPFQEETVPDWALLLASVAIPILAVSVTDSGSFLGAHVARKRVLAS